MKNKPKGQILVVINILMSVLLIYSLALVNLALAARQFEKTSDFKLIAQNIAEAGIQKAVWCFNQTDGSNCNGTFGGGYAGETDVAFGGGIYDLNVSDIDITTKEVEAIAYFPNKTKTLSKSIIKTRIATDTDLLSFSYGAQMGEGGLEMGQNAVIHGSVYAENNIIGANGARIAGDVYVAGGTALTADQAYTDYNLDFIFGQNDPQVDIAQSFIPNTSEVLNKVSFYIKKISAPFNISVKIVNDSGGAPGTMVYSSTALDSSLVSTNYGWIDVAFASPAPLTSGIKYWIVLDAKKSSIKYWTVGADAFDNYGNGTMVYSSDWDDDPWIASGNDINFKTWMGGVDTEISNIEVDNDVHAHTVDTVIAGGNAYAYNLLNSTISGDAIAYFIDDSDIGQNASSTDIIDSSVGANLWCETFTNVSVGDSNFCPTSITPPSDPGPIDLPITDAIINDWKTDAENGGIIEGDYLIEEDSSLGPVKINGNLTIDGGALLTLTGTLYVTGDITLANNTSVTLDALYGSNSGIFMADRTISVSNNVQFSGAGPNSFLTILSNFDSPTDPAIDINNNSNTAILFAPHGIIDIINNATLKQVNAKKLLLSNNTQVFYETGLSSVSFSSGPTGGWTELKGFWRIIE
ncbi:hypothetical protein ACFL29_01850 [Patescibacteria group bacterium]